MNVRNVAVIICAPVHDERQFRDKIPPDAVNINFMKKLNQPFCRFRGYL